MLFPFIDLFDTQKQAILTKQDVTTTEGHHTVYASNTSNTWNSGTVLYNGTYLPNEINFDAVFRVLTYVPPVHSPFIELELCEIGIIECNDGSYGKDCLEKCSANCWNTTCNHVTGKCIGGCKDGWQGFNCSQTCIYGDFGTNCAHKCYCLSAPCSKEDGMCPPGGCEAGFHGKSCNQGVDETIQRIDTTTNAIGRTVQRNETAVNRIDQTVTGTNTAVMGIQATMEELLYYAKRGITCQCSIDKCQQQVKQVKESIKPYTLGQPIFTLHHEIYLTSVVGGDWSRIVTDIVMMDDGRLVMCLPYQYRLLICNTDGSQVDSIDVQGIPWYVTAVNNSTVAVTLYDSRCIEMYDINNKLKLKSISVPGMWWESDITTINNKLVVGGDKRLLIIDHQTGEVVQTIQTDCDPCRLHGSGDRIFYYNNNYNNLYWYSYTDDRHHTLTLPSQPGRMTTLQDGSLYVVCSDGSVQHVSSDGKQYKPVKTFQSTPDWHYRIHYNLIQRKLVFLDNKLIKIFNEL
ncbi:unnamed protein product [Mytilus edulis]|uniref:Uncharacterized protein n=1 Tax=Mytilus edulis TaxID=6550 RepID=A0A8S3QGY2_MYTED|nr:unnamed protein product [Mytilus edulis]